MIAIEVDTIEKMILSPNDDDFNLAVTILQSKGIEDNIIIQYCYHLTNPYNYLESTNTYVLDIDIKKYSYTLVNGFIERHILTGGLWNQLNTTSYKALYKIGDFNLEMLTEAIDSFYNKKVEI